MKDLTTAPVTAIESIGPRIAGLLAEIDVRYVADICLFPVSRLHRAVSSVTNAERVAGWRTMAYLLWVPDMTPQWAEALWTAGIGTLEKFSSVGLGGLRETFAAARQKRIISTVPSDDELARMMCDAVILTHSGQLTGRVIDSQGQGIADVEIHIGARRAHSDERGLFHLRGIPPGRDLPLVVETPPGAQFRFDPPPVEKDFYLIGVHEFSLSSGQPIAADDDRLLSEWSGDLLPSLAGAESRVVRLEDGELREGDILLFRKVVANGDAELVSRFRAFQRGHIVVHTMRLPLSRLPGRAQAGQHFRVERGELMPVRIDASRLRMLRKARQAIAVVGDSLPAPVSASDYAEWFRKVFEQMR